MQGGDVLPSQLNSDPNMYPNHHIPSAFSPTASFSPSPSPTKSMANSSHAEVLSGLDRTVLNSNFNSLDGVQQIQLPASFSHGELVALAGGLPPFGLVNATPFVDSSQAGTVAPHSATMDLDLAYGSAQSTPSSTGSTPTLGPRTYAFYPPVAAPPVVAHHSSTQRHHPYAHAVRPIPPTLPHSVSNASALPLYFTQSSPSATIPGDVSSSAFPNGVPIPHRVHSAPAHTLVLAQNGESHSSRLVSMTPDLDGQPPRRFEVMTGMEDGMGGGAGYEPNWDSAALQAHTSSSARDWDGDRSQIERPLSAATIKVNDDQTQAPSGYFDSTALISQVSTYPPPSSIPSISSPGGNVSNHDTAIPAIALLRNRLPILEAALSVSASAPGEDEEVIWKGVEGAFDELKRVMVARMESRREVMAQRDGVKRSYAAMDMESNASSDRSISVAKFLASQIHPPLVHSQSNPDVPLTSNANVARAQAQLQASQLQLQQAQIQHAQNQHAQAQQVQHAEAHARVEAQVLAERSRSEDARARVEDARARAEADARARAEADARSRLEDARIRAEAENHARAVAEEDARQQEAFQHQQQQQHMLQQTQILLAQQQMHQQQQEAIAHQQQQEAMSRQLLLQQQEAIARQEAAIAHQQNQDAAVARQQQEAAIAHQQRQQELAQLHDLARSAQHPVRYTSPPPYPPPVQYPSTISPVPLPTPTHSLHGSHTPSPLTTSHPSRQGSAMSHSMSLPPTPLTVNPAQVLGYAPSPTFDMSMGAVMQMHLRAQPYDPLAAVDTSNGISLAALETIPASVDAMQEVWERGSASPRQSMGATLSPSLGQAITLASPPPATLQRPTRSRAASASGYISSTAGSRSRAASGSGFQSLIDTRSRAVSSASSAFYQVEKETDDENDELEEDKPVGGRLGAAITTMDLELKAQLEPPFLEFLQTLCSNLEATDSKGELIHQTLMAKKMEKLDASTDFRPFKFRIQAFTSAFAEKLSEIGMTDADVPLKRIRQYLWAQPLISRFNDDGKKSKSKGNHIWSIEARNSHKDPPQPWEFREFCHCIKVVPAESAPVGELWTWSPRIWSPQSALTQSTAVFSATGLPSWLSWKNRVLSGTPTEAQEGAVYDIVAQASFPVAEALVTVDYPFSIVVVSQEPEDDADISDDVEVSDSIEVGTATSTPFHSPGPVDLPVFGAPSLLPSLLPALGLLNFDSSSPRGPASQTPFLTHSAGGPQSPQQLLRIDEGMMLQRQLEANQLHHQQYLHFATENQMQIDASSHLASLQHQAAPHQYHPPLPEEVARALQHAQRFEQARDHHFVPMTMDLPVQNHSQHLLPLAEGEFSLLTKSQPLAPTPFSFDAIPHQQL